MQLNKSSIISVTTESQIEQVAELAKQIWTKHYTPIIGNEQVHYMLEKFQSKHAITDQINKHYHYFLITTTYPIGYCAYLIEGTSLFLSKIYILHSEQGYGFGRKLMSHVIDKAQDAACNQIRLTVNKYNSNSIAAYYKMGFVKNKEIIFDIGNGYIMDDYEFILKL